MPFSPLIDAFADVSFADMLSMLIISPRCRLADASHAVALFILLLPPLLRYCCCDL